MCGICGAVTRDAKATIDRGLLVAMTELLRHRGPDGDGYFLAPGVGLGMRRLSIVDLEAGDQPIGNEDGSIQIVCNGEIYNSPVLLRELSHRGHRLKGHSDVEAIVHLYEELGMGCLHQLRGMFAFALWDARRSRLVLARDRFGIKPLYYGESHDGTLYFGSEAKSVLFTDQVDRSLDPVGIAGILDLGGPFYDRSAFRGVKQLQPGHWLTYEEGRIEKGQYWDLEFPPSTGGDLPRGEREWAEVFHDKIKETVRIHLLGDVPMAAWLSPGIDSTTVAYFAAREVGDPLPTFSLGFDDPKFDELRHGRTLDQFAGYGLSGRQVSFGGTFLEDLPLAVWHQEQPVTLQFTYQLLGAAMSGGLKVALTGQGSDEMLGGYPWYRLDQMWAPLYWLPQPVRRQIAKWFPRISETDRRAIGMPTHMCERRYSGLHWSRWGDIRQLFLPEFGQAVDDAEESLELPRFPDCYRRWDRFQQLMYVESKTRLPSYINRGLDASSMALSVEARLPFLDHELAAFMGSIPPSLRSRTREKHLLRKAMEPHLPGEIVWRKKRGLRSPDAFWKEAWGQVPEFARHLLEDPVVRAKGYFRPEAVADLARRAKGLTSTLAAVVGFHLLDELLVQGKGPPPRQIP